jgi:hypothetical protein
MAEEEMKKTVCCFRDSNGETDPSVLKSAELYEKGTAAADKGELALSQSRQLKRAAAQFQKDIDKLQGKYRKVMERANRLFVEGHDLLDQAKQLWQESTEVLPEEKK